MLGRNSNRSAGPASGSIVLFGARKMGRTVLAGLASKAGIEPSAFSEQQCGTSWGQSSMVWRFYCPGTRSDGVGDSAISVITIWGHGRRPMYDTREKAPDARLPACVSLVPLFWKFAETSLDRDSRDGSSAQSTRAIRCSSKGLYDTLRPTLTVGVRCATSLEASLRFRHPSRPGRRSIYFPDDVVSATDGEVFVDVGAYDGDTLLAFLKHCDSRFRRVIAFEPDPVNLDRLQRTVGELPENIRRRIRVVPAGATGAQQGTVRFSATGGPGSKMDAGEVQVPCVTLDESLDGDSPTYIKMDIEAAEPSALMGASRIVSRLAPVLAVVAYHIQDHLWKLPCLMHSLNPEYRIFLRPHIQLVEDLVCYGVPPGRAVPGGERGLWNDRSSVE